MVGAGALSMMALGEYEAKETQRAINYLFKNANIVLTGGWPYYSAYYCVQAMYQVGGKYWEEWYPKVQKTILQHLKGGKVGESIGGEISGGDVVGTGFAIIALSIPKGLMPLFQR
jgi:hypothetical protein